MSVKYWECHYFWHTRYTAVFFLFVFFLSLRWRFFYAFYASLWKRYLFPMLSSLYLSTQWRMFFCFLSCSISEIEGLLRIVRVRMSIGSTISGISMLLESYQCNKYYKYKGLNIWNIKLSWRYWNKNRTSSQ